MRPTFTGLRVAMTEPLAELELAGRLPCWTICGSTSSEIFCPAFFVNAFDFTAVDTDDWASDAEPVSVVRSRDAGSSSAATLPASTRRADM